MQLERDRGRTKGREREKERGKYAVKETIVEIKATTATKKMGNRQRREH